MPYKLPLLLFLLISFALPALAAPQVAAEQTSFAFGNLYQGEKASHTFTFSNSGDAPLIVEKVRSSCGCTAVMASKKSLQPGESGEIEATFNSTSFRGPVSKKVYLYTNDPKRKNFEFSLTATVKEIVTRTPHRVSANGLIPGKPHTTTIELRNNWIAPLQITEVQAGLAQMQTELENSTLEPGQTIPLKVTITPDRQKRRLNSYIILKTDNELLPEIRLPVFYLVNLGG